jgi:hypothetical protein
VPSTIESRPVVHLRTLTAIAALLIASSARAEPSKTDRSLAQSLFDQAKQQMASGNYDQACPKLEESQRLDPGGGTLLNLALCHEKQGKIATAWTEFKEALSAAKRDGREERISAAQEHIAALQPKLPWLTLSVTSPVDGQELKLDGAFIGRAAWDAPLSVDPGVHELEATAPGKVKWTSSLSISIAEKKTLSVPKLADDAAAAAAPDAPPADSPPAKAADAPTEDAGGSRKTLGWVIGGIGVAALGVGAYFGFDTLSKKKDSDEECPAVDQCSRRGVELNDQAHRSAWVSNIGLGLGVVGVGVGTFLLLSGRSSDAPPAKVGRVRLDAAPLPGGAQMTMRGAF